MYNLDFSKLVKGLTPWFLRSPKFLSWLNALVSPLVSLYNDFLVFKESRIFLASVSGQVGSMEFMLNKVMFNDGDARQIYITDASRANPFYIFNTDENRPVYLYNSAEASTANTLYNSSERTGFDFTVWVPATLNYDNYLYSLIDQHKAAGFQFLIKTY
jgi:hypothetical protein